MAARRDLPELVRGARCMVCSETVVDIALAADCRRWAMTPAAMAAATAMRTMIPMIRDHGFLRAAAVDAELAAGTTTLRPDSVSRRRRFRSERNSAALW